ncbi:MAG: hypothetical protein KA604_02645 [Candidatus Saccharimonas sp.]|nr:hypothetical protein [Candidatus Saccharimonas sp.]
MWLKKLVAISMIITLIGMNTITLIGFFSPAKVSNQTAQTQAVSLPAISLTATPASVVTGSFSALKWSVEGKVVSCRAEGDWSGEKTPFGAESTGRLSTAGNKSYTLVCKNSSGETRQTVTVAVTVEQPSGATTPSGPAAPVVTPNPTVVYCQGASPCYGPKDVATHASIGNCWGYNGNRVINISGFDTSFHSSKSGVSSIEISSICGKDLSPALRGSVNAEGQSRNHNTGTKNNADRSMIPYFVGYFDATKP